MKDKTAAARVLLEAGWTWEEIVAVLAPQPAPAVPQLVPVPYQPYPGPWCPPTPVWGDGTITIAPA